jgi:hypothetical protein
VRRHRASPAPHGPFSRSGASRRRPPLHPRLVAVTQAVRSQAGWSGQPVRDCDILGGPVPAALAPAAAGVVGDQAAVTTTRERPPACAASPSPGVACEADDSPASRDGVGRARECGGPRRHRLAGERQARVDEHRSRRAFAGGRVPPVGRRPEEPSAVGGAAEVSSVQGQPRFEAPTSLRSAVTVSLIALSRVAISSGRQPATVAGFWLAPVASPAGNAYSGSSYRPSISPGVSPAGWLSTSSRRGRCTTGRRR